MSNLTRALFNFVCPIAKDCTIHMPEDACYVINSNGTLSKFFATDTDIVFDESTLRGYKISCTASLNKVGLHEVKNVEQITNALTTNVMRQEDEILVDLLHYVWSDSKKETIFLDDETCQLFVPNITKAIFSHQFLMTNYKDLYNRFEVSKLHFSNHCHDEAFFILDNQIGYVLEHKPLTITNETDMSTLRVNYSVDEKLCMIITKPSKILKVELTKHRFEKFLAILDN